RSGHVARGTKLTSESRSRHDCHYCNPCTLNGPGVIRDRCLSPKFKFTSLRARGSWRTLFAFFLSALRFLLPTTSGRSPARSTAGLRVGSLASLFSAWGLTTSWSCTSGGRSAGLCKGSLPFLFSSSTLIRSRLRSRRNCLLRSTTPILALLRQLIHTASGLFRSRLGNAALELSFVFTRRLRRLGSA